MINTFNKVAASLSEILEFNEANLSGCVDVIIVKQTDGSLKGTGFHVRFGKFQVMKPKGKIVRIEINDEPTSIVMKLGRSGEAYFEEEVTDPNDSDSREVFSEISSSSSSGENSLYTSRTFSTQTENLNQHNKPGLVLKGDQESGLLKSLTKRNNGFIKSIIEKFKKGKNEKNKIKVERLISSSADDQNKKVNIKNESIEDKMDLFEDIGLEGNIKIPPSINLFHDRNKMGKKESALISKVTEASDFDSNKLITSNSTTADSQIDQDSPPKSEFGNNSSPDSNISRRLKTILEEENAKVEACFPFYEKNEMKPRIRRTLRLNSEKIKLLNLRPGQNKITYTIDTDLQGTQKLSAHIYLWSSDVKIIASDVDGTITKSDVLGAILPIFGKDWTQPGIAPLFSNIIKNGYKVIYLTSRAIGQICFTRDFVKSVTQEGEKLPEGPIISSADKLFPCFKREIVFSKPEYFKAAALRDIKNLFPLGENPFYAGFGNRESFDNEVTKDAVAYRFIGIPLENIFTVNPKGVVNHSYYTLHKPYAFLNEKVKEMFPCIENFNEDG